MVRKRYGDKIHNLFRLIALFFFLAGVVDEARKLQSVTQYSFLLLIMLLYLSPTHFLIPTPLFDESRG